MNGLGGASLHHFAWFAASGVPASSATAHACLSHHRGAWL